jgi:orotidine-5'-phosphate decarboxylase
MNYEPSAKLILALDVDSFNKAKYFVNKLYPQVKIFKVGSQLFTACGPKIIDFIHKKGAEVFLDLKFNDIPNTMSGAARQALKYKVAMFTVHTLSGPAALKEVANVCKNSKTKVLGVAILTSICPHFLQGLGIKKTLSQEALYLARMAKRCGLDGVVCSVREAALLRKALPRKFIIVTPGIRPDGAKSDDQKRTATVKDAIRAGSDFLVIGRPILEAENSLLATKKILDSLKL